MMESEIMTIRYFLFSSSKSFRSSYTKKIDENRHGREVIQFDSLESIDEGTFYSSDIFLIDEILFKDSNYNYSSFIELVSSTTNHVVVFSDFKRSFPPFIFENQSRFKVVSKSTQEEEFVFLLDSLDFQIGSCRQVVGRHKEKYLETIIHVQEKLKPNISGNHSMSNVLGLIGNVSNASRVILFENQHDAKGNPSMSQKETWVRDGEKDQFENPLFFTLPYNPNFARWYKVFSKGDYICQKVKDLPAGERSLLEAAVIFGILCVPIIIKGNFWGFIMLTVPKERSLWHKDEISLISRPIFN